jgi:hypothetical protein
MHLYMCIRVHVCLRKGHVGVDRMQNMLMMTTMIKLGQCKRVTMGFLVQWQIVREGKGECDRDQGQAYIHTEMGGPVGGLNSCAAASGSLSLLTSSLSTVLCNTRESTSSSTPLNI